MILKIILVMMSSGFNGFLLKQDDTTIDVSEIDAFVHSIPSEHRQGYISKVAQFEKDIYTILNVNLVYNYLSEKNLMSEVSSDQKIIENEFTNSIDKDFVTDLGYSVEEFNEILKEFDNKKQYVVAYQHYLFNQVDNSDADELAEEHYYANRSSYISKKSMDISQISLLKENYTEDKAIEIMNYISDGDKNRFTEMAVEHSSDPSVKSNQGNLGVYKEDLYTGKVGRNIFKLQNAGFSKQLFQDENKYYLIYINQINEEATIPFESVKDKLRDSIKQKIADSKFKNIMASISSAEVEVNIDKLATIQQRYVDDTE